MHLDTLSIKQLNRHFKFCHFYSFPLFRSIHSFCSPWSHIDISQCLANVICFPLAFVCSLTISGFLVPVPVFTYIKLLLPVFLAFHQTASKPFDWSSKTGIRRCPQKSLIPRPIPSLSTHPTDSKKPFPRWPVTLHHSPLWMFAVWLRAAPKASFQCFLHRSEMSGCLPLILLCALLHRTMANLPCRQLPTGRSSQTKFCQTPPQISSRLCGKSGNRI